MDARKAKAIRKEVYGDHSPRYTRKYKRLSSGQVIADPARRLYQQMKKNN